MLDNLPWTYCGLVDDAIFRTEYRALDSIHSLNSVIVKNILFGGGLLINDGYILHNSELLNALLDEDSLLRICMRNGFVKILVRGVDEFGNPPKDPIARLANHGIVESKKMRNDSLYNAQRVSIHRIISSAFSSGAAIAWPNYQTSTGFLTLFGRLFDFDSNDLKKLDIRNDAVLKLRDRIEENKGISLGAGRSIVEEELRFLLNTGVLKRDEFEKIMRFAIRAYHYNFTICQSKSMMINIVPQTIGGYGFGDILSIDVNALEEIRPDEIPAISIPRGFPMDDPRVFENIIDNSSAIFRAKQEFRQNIDDVFSKKSNMPTNERVRVAREVIENYIERLSENFSKHVGHDAIFPNTSFAIKWSIEFMAGGFIGLAIQVLGRNNRLSRSIATARRRFDSRILQVNMNPANNKLKKEFEFSLNDAAPWFSEIQIDPSFVDDHIAGVPKYRKSD